MHEDIAGFLPEPGVEYPFYLEMAGISYCDGSYRIQRACSTIYVLEYILRGRGTVHSDGVSFTAKTGDIYLLHKGASHLYYSDSADPWIKVWMNFRGPLADSMLIHYQLSRLSHAEGIDISPLFAELLNAARSARGSSGEIHLDAAVIFHRMLQQIHMHTRKTPDTVPQAAVDLKTWLDNHIHLRASVEELSAQIYRSPSQAIRIFKSAYGITPYEYLLGKRIDTAKLLLKNTPMPVKEIAAKLQFADEHYFSNYFKKRVGASPSDFRKNAGVP